MSALFHLVVLLFSVWLTYSSGHVINNTDFQCAEHEKVALLKFKHGIRVDNCGLLHSWKTVLIAASGVAFTAATVLAMSSVSVFLDLSAATDTWLPIVNSLPFLQVLRLDVCHLSLELPSSLSYVNSSTTLNVVSLIGNNMNDTSIFEWLSKLKGLDTSLQYLDLYLIETNICYDFSKIVQSFSTLF